jgi:hypothetical protein
MQVIVDSIKRSIHREIASRPVTLAWALNLYRAGERYPQTVCDYFPADHAPWPELADHLRRHRRDEERHTSMYAHAIRSLGQPIVEVADEDVLNVVIRSFTSESFTIVESDDGDARRRKIAHFLTHAHFLEKRVARSLEYHRDACAASDAKDAQRVVEAVLRDEGRHVAYTIEAAKELLTAEERGAVFAHHRRAEAKANLEFSQRQIRAFLRAASPALRVERRALYRFCAFLLEEAVAYV